MGLCSCVNYCWFSFGCSLGVELVLVPFIIAAATATVCLDLLRFNPHGPLSLVFDGQPRTLILCGLHLVRRQWSLWVCTMVVGLLLSLRATWSRHDGRMAAA